MLDRPAGWDGLEEAGRRGDPRWAPDGRRLLFIRGEENDLSREPDIFLINRDGSGEQKLRPGRWPDWSPDGKKIAFSQGGSPGGGVKVGAVLSICEADGTGRRELIEGDSPS